MIDPPDPPDPPGPARLLDRDQKLLQARALMATARSVEAVPILEGLVAASPSDSGLRGVLAMACWNAGQRTKAIDHAQEASHLDREAPDPAHALAWILLQRGGSQRAVGAAREFAWRAPDDPAALAILAVAEGMIGRPALGRPSATRLVELHPDSPRGHELLGHISLVEGSWDRAAVEYAQALEVDGTSHVARVGRGIARCRSGRRVDGIADLQAAHTAEPIDSWGWRMLAMEVMAYLRPLPLIAIGVALGTLAILLGGSLDALSTSIMVGLALAVVGVLTALQVRRRRRIDPEVRRSFSWRGPNHAIVLRLRAVDVGLILVGSVVLGVFASVAAGGVATSTFELNRTLPTGVLPIALIVALWARSRPSTRQFVRPLGRAGTVLPRGVWLRL